MKRWLTIAAIFFSVWTADILRAQQCQMNMLSLPDSSSYALIAGISSTELGSSFTIECWVQSLRVRKNIGIAEIGRSGDSGTIRLYFDDASRIAVTASFTGGDVTLVTPVLQQAIDWNHLAVSFGNDTLRIYLNGLLAQSLRVGKGALRHRGDTLILGRSTTLDSYLFGNIDEFRIWTTTRTLSDIQSALNETVADSAKNLFAYYRCDDRPALRRLYDFTGHGRTAVLVSNAVSAETTSPVTSTIHQGYMLSAREKRVTMQPVICKTTVDTIVHITNIGIDTLKIGTIAFVNGSQGFSVANSTGFPLPPDKNKFATVKIQYDVLGTGTFADELVIASATQCGGKVSIPFSIKVDTAGMSFDESELLVGNVVRCALPQLANVTLRNTGGTDLTITSAFFTQSVGVEYVSPPLPFTLAKGSSQQISVRIKDGTQGAFWTRLRLTAKECNKQSEVAIGGVRTELRFLLPQQIIFPVKNYTTSGSSIDTSFVLRNTGTSDLFVSGMNITGSGYRLLQPITGLAYLQPGDSTVIRIRFDGKNCGIYTGQLRLTGKPCALDTTVTFRMEITGPKLIAPNLINVGASCSPIDTTITITNVSDMAVTLSPMQFSAPNVFLVIPPSPLPRTLLPNESVTIGIRFAPAKPGAHLVSAVIPLIPCGEQRIELRAILGVADVTPAQPMLDFGAQCDLLPVRSTITITNHSAKNISVTSAAINGSQSFRVISPSVPFALPAFGTRTITVEYAPLTYGSDSADLIADQNGCFVTSFPIRGERQISSFTLLERSVNFDTVCPGTTKKISVEMENTGNGTLTFLAQSANVPQFGFDRSLLTIPPRSKRTITLTFTPDAVAQYSGEYMIIVGPCSDTIRIRANGVGGPAVSMTVVDTKLAAGTVRLGDTIRLCTEIRNRSCIPAHITASSLSLNGSFAFRIAEETLQKLPFDLTQNTPLILCFDYVPIIEGTEQTHFSCKIGNQEISIDLEGIGMKERVRLSPRVLDFGDVIISASRTLIDTLTNISPLSISIRHSDPALSVFSVQTMPNSLPAGRQYISSISFTPDVIDDFEDTLFVMTRHTVDTLLMRGRGVGVGAAVNTTSLDFGTQRINTSQKQTLAITTADGNPVQISNLRMNGSTSYRFDPPSLLLILTSADTSFIDVWYTPPQETGDTADLLFDDDAGNTRITRLTGTGVEAHLAVDTALIDFGVVRIGDKLERQLRINNTGGYPLTITDARPVLGDVFDLTVLPQSRIAPHTGEVFRYTFTPKKDVIYFDTITIFADAPERSRSVVLRGEGDYGDVRWSLPSVEARVGDILNIPVMLSGADASRLVVDTLSLTLHYNPTVMYIHSVLPAVPITENMQIAFAPIPRDSLLRISASGSFNAAEGIALFIRAEALLGPTDSTVMQIIASTPRNRIPQSEPSAVFRVMDCDSLRTSIRLKGKYALAEPNPNPIHSTLTVQCTLGLEAPADMTIYDIYGRTVKQISTRSLPAGSHTLFIDVSDLASGQYIIRLTSLEFRAEQKFIILR